MKRIEHPMSLLTRTPVGTTHLQVPILGLGMAPLAGLYADISEHDALTTIHAALEQGITFFDTAPLYGSGRGERFLGKALQGVARDQYVIATKVGYLVTPQGTCETDFTRDGILRSFEASLRRLQLQLQSIDIIHIHEPPAELITEEFYQKVADEVVPTLLDLRNQGAIQAIGAGCNYWEVLNRLARIAHFDCFLLAGRYTLLEHQRSRSFLDTCLQERISIFLGGVYNSGILATGARTDAKYQYAAVPESILKQVQHIERICQRYHVPLSGVAQRFALSHPAVHAGIIGMASPAEVARNKASLSLPIPTALWHDLYTEGLIDQAAYTLLGD